MFCLTSVVGIPSKAAYNRTMDFRGMARVARTFKIKVGGFRARGAPAVIVAVSGLTLVTGLVRAVNQNAATLPEAFREAKGLIDALKAEGSGPRLKS